MAESSKRAAEEADADAAAKRPRVDDAAPGSVPSTNRPKRKVALLLAYNGAGYSGLQINPDVETIEKTLEEAIFRAGGISEANRGVLQKVSWSRAGRTDKGVHAVGQIISLKMMLEPEPMLIRINQQLVDSGVQLLAFERVNNSFCAHTMCSGREYEYLLPATLLTAPPPLLAVPAPATTTAALADVSPADATAAPMPDAPSAPDAAPASAAPAANEHLTAEATARLRELLRKFEGTQSFHNFTDGKVTSADKTATRYMISFTTGEPLTLGGVAYVPLRFHGQSFLLHQIRKMVGLTAATFRGDVSPDAIEVALRPGRVAPIPMAPSCALLLRRCLYTPYERKRVAEKFADRNSVHFPECEAAKEHFLTEHILPNIAKSEAAGEFERFAVALSSYSLQRSTPVCPVGANNEAPVAEVQAPLAE